MLESDAQNYFNQKFVKNLNSFKWTVFSNNTAIHTLLTVTLPGCCHWVLPNWNELFRPPWRRGEKWLICPFLDFVFYIHCFLFYHFHVISDWFLNVFPHIFCIFCSLSYPKHLTLHNMIFSVIRYITLKLSPGNLPQNWGWYVREKKTLRSTYRLKIWSFID